MRDLFDLTGAGGQKPTGRDQIDMSRSLLPGSFSQSDAMRARLSKSLAIQRERQLIQK